MTFRNALIFGLELTVIIRCVYSESFAGSIVTDQNENISSIYGPEESPLTVAVAASRTNLSINAICSISAKATGNAPLTYQWRHAGVDIPGATADTLFFPSMAAGDFGTYTCVVTTPNGTVESNAVTVRLDSEGDGLPDDWEIATFGDLTKTGGQDSDGDGSSNAQELADGTNPNNPTEARVALTMLNLPGGTVTVDPPGARPMKGSTVTLTAVSGKGLFRSWVGASTAITPVITLTMDGDKEIGAAFGELVAWGTRSLGDGVSVPPPGQQDVKAVSLGLTSFAFMAGDTVSSWPINSPLQTSGAVTGTGGGATHLIDRNGRLRSSLLPLPPSLNPVVKVASAAHAVALQQDGTVVCWGASGGNRTAVPPGLSNVIDVAASGEGSLALRADGTVTVWGNFVPVPPAAVNYGFRAIAAGSYHAVGLRHDGTVAMWGLTGNYDQGQYQNQPANLSGVVAISAGWNHTVALKADGSVVAWGRNDEGQTTIPAQLTKAVGISAAENESAAVYASPANNVEPLVCAVPAAIAVVGYPFQHYISAKGSPTSYGVRGLPNGLSLNPATGVISGTPEQFGRFQVDQSATNARGTGAERLILHILPPSPIYSWNSLVPSGLAGVVSFDAGYGFSIAALKDGSVKVWGTGNAALTPPVGLSGVVAVAAGNDFALALKADGTLTAWGSSGLVGGVPAVLRDVVGIDCGGNHAVALRASGAVIAWGSNAIANAPTGFIKQVVSAERYSSGLRWDGAVHVWGGTFDIPGFPPGGLTGVAKLASSANHTLGLKADGTVVGWGTNTQGELNIPEGLNDAVDVAAANGYSVALRSNGQVVVWGRASEIALAANAPTGVALSSMGDHVLLMTQTEPSVTVPHLAMPRYLLVPPNFAYSTRIVAQNSPGAYGATGLPPGLGVDVNTGVISGTPAMPGAYPVTLSATNGGGTGTHSLTIIVPGATTYAQWAVSRALAVNSSQVDSDGDGLTNLAEYALGRDPLVRDGTDALLLSDASGAVGNKEFLFGHPTATTDVIYEMQVSHDLLQWMTVALGRAGAPMIDLLEGGRASESYASPVLREAVVTATIPNQHPREFTRLKFTLEPPPLEPPPLYELRAEDYTNVGGWINRGTVGGAFTAEGAPKAGVLDGAYAVSFALTDSFVGPALPGALVGGVPQTVEIWAYNNNADNLESLVVFDGGRGEPYYRYGYGTNGLLGALAQRFSPNLGWDPAYTANAPGGIVPAQGKWHHLAFVYAAGTLSIYVDGLLHRSDGVGIGLPATAPRLGSEFSGAIGRLRIHGRSLTALEIAASHAAERPFYPFAAPGAPLQAAPSHRYSFSLPAGPVVDGTPIPDLIGTNALVLKGAGAVSLAGQVDLPGGSSASAAYVDIPNGLANATPDVSLEFWFTPESLGNYPRLFDMGPGSAGELNGPGGSATGGPDYVFYALSTTAEPQQLFWLRRNYQDRYQLINGKVLNQQQHVVITYSTTTSAWVVYNDGVKVGEFVTSDGPQTIPSLNTWIGRSNWTADPNLDGKINEFRIYPRALTAGEVRGNFQAGPDVVNLSQ